MTLKQLEKAESQASDAFDELRNERDHKRSALLSKAAQKIDAALEAEYASRLKELLEKRNAALLALQEARIADASKDAPWPIGTELCGWERAREGWRGTRSGPWVIVAHGILEVVTHETKHPASLGGYSRASIGEYIVRLKKKDGTLSLKYENLEGWRSKTWLPVGEKPKEKAE
jgi:hypothetical protein